MSVQPAARQEPEKKRLGVVYFSDGQALGKCESTGCTFQCRCIDLNTRLSVKTARKSLQNHINHEHRLQVSQYYLELLEGDGPDAK